LDFLTIGFLLLIVLVSGGIAVFADNLGRKLGKKRLSIGRMRPRHVANLGVFLSGVIVSLLTIGLVGFFSADVRRWLLYGRRAIQELGVVTEQLGQLKAQSDHLELQNKLLTITNREREQKAKEQQKLLDSQKAEIAKRKLEVGRLQASVASSQRRINQLDGQLKRNAAELQKNQIQLQAAQQQLNLAKGQLSKVQAETRKANETRNVAVKDANEVNLKNIKLETDNSALERRISTLNRTLSTLNTDTETLLKQKEEAANELVESQKRVNAAQYELDKLTAELTKVQNEYQLSQAFSQTISSTFEKTRLNPMIFRRGDEVGRLEIPARALEAEAAEAFDRFLATCRVAASARGAKPNGPFMAADIMGKTGGVLSTEVTPAQIRQAAVRQLTDSKTDLVLVGYSTLNAFAGEPVSLELGLYPNPVIYRDGEILSQTMVEGQREASVIYRQISEFLATKLSDKVRSDKLIPKVGDEGPFGSVSTDEILEAVIKARRLNRKAFVRAIVVKDTRSAGPLRIRLDVR